MVEAIKQKIVLEGADEVEKQLADIGKAGEEAFDKIEKAAGQAGFRKVTEEVDKIGAASEKAVEPIRHISQATSEAAKSTEEFTKATEGLSLQAAKTTAEIAKLTAETVKTGFESAKIAVDIGKTGVEIYKSVTRTKTWGESLTDLGSHLGLVRTAASAFGPAIARMFGPLGIAVTAVLTAKAAFDGLSSSMEKTTEASEKVAKPFAEIAKTLEQLVLSTGQSYDSLQRGQALFEQLGVSSETFRESIAKVATELDGLDVDESLKESADAIVEANKKVKDLGFDRYAIALNDIAGLEKNRAETAKAQTAVTEAQANSLGKVLKQVEAIEQGQQGIKFDALVKGKTIGEAVALSLKHAQESGENAGVVLLKFIANAERAQAIEVGKKFGLSEEQVDRVKLLGGHLGAVDEIWKRIQGAGVLIPEASIKVFKDLNDQAVRLEQAKTRFSQAWDSSFLATLGAQFTSTFSGIETTLYNFAARTVEVFNAAFRGLGDPIESTKRELIGIGAALVAAGDYITAFLASWVGTPIAGAWHWINDTFWSVVSGMLPSMETVKGWITTWVTTPVANAWQWVLDKWHAMLAELGFGGGGSPAGGGAAPQMMASGGMIGGRGTGTSDSNLAWVSRGEYIMPARAVRQPGVLAFLEGLRGGGRSGSRGGLPAFADGGSVGMVQATSIDQIVEAFNNIAQNIADGFSVVAMEETVQRGFEGMSKDFRSLFDAMKNVSEELAKKNKHALGGLLGGRGTGTSDSNLAWVSRGEHIMPARAVRQPGVLAFLEALRRSGGNLSRVLEGMGRYAAGGLVMPSLVTAGSGGMNNVTIQFPGLPSIGGLRASSQVVEELQRAAAMAQVRSGGRKPSRYR